MNEHGTDIYRERITELSRERIAIVPYDPAWPQRYAEEEDRLARSLPPALIRRIAHIGSTSVPGLSAKPIIDVQVEVTGLDLLRREVVPIMEGLAYEFIWRTTMGERAPYYAWFIKRNERGERTFHVHMVEPDAASDDRIRFRDLLRADPALLRRYASLKRELLERFAHDRAAFTQGKTSFIRDALRDRPTGLTCVAAGS